MNYTKQHRNLRNRSNNTESLEFQSTFATRRNEAKRQGIQDPFLHDPRPQPWRQRDVRPTKTMRNRTHGAKLNFEAYPYKTFTLSVCYGDKRQED